MKIKPQMNKMKCRKSKKLKRPKSQPRNKYKKKNQHSNRKSLRKRLLKNNNDYIRK